VKAFAAAILLTLSCCAPLSAVLAAPAASAPSAKWDALHFLEGSWEAHTQGGSANAQGAGSYSFKRELKQHVLVRRSESAAGCKGPADFDCGHHDVLYVYEDPAGEGLQAIYFDDEGHVIHYTVTTPEPSTAIFTSPASPSAPQFQLIYQLKREVMSGKFQMRMPGQSQWRPYLEWSGRARSSAAAHAG
jgi:hypothetical protein